MSGRAHDKQSELTITNYLRLQSGADIIHENPDKSRTVEPTLLKTGVTAKAGGGQTNAVALKGRFNNITTCATDGDSVKLLSASIGQMQVVKNSGATSLAVFPALADSINAMAINLSVNIPPGGMLTFRAKDAIVWETQEVITLSSPSTQKGELIWKATDQAGDTVMTFTNASQAQATTVTFPDVGATATPLMAEGAQTISGVKTYSASPQTTVGVGAVSGTNITVVETGDVIHKTVFTLTAHRLTMTDSGAQGGHGSQLIYTFPDGHIKLISGHAEVTVFSAVGTGAADSGVYDIGVGTTATATDNEELATTEQDLVVKMEGTLDGSGDLSAAENGKISADATFDGSATSVKAYFNAAITAATQSANEDFDVTAVVTLVWINQGNDST